MNGKFSSNQRALGKNTSIIKKIIKVCNICSFFFQLLDIAPVYVGLHLANLIYNTHNVS